jgi:hypothetical protein
VSAVSPIANSSIQRMELFLRLHQLFQFVNAFAAATVANSCSVVANAYLITGPSTLDRWHLYFLQ